MIYPRNQREVFSGATKIAGGDHTLFIAGPCVIESCEHAALMLSILRDYFIHIIPHGPRTFIFKASWDKANRTSGNSFRGSGLDSGISVFQYLKELYPDTLLLTDVHETWQVEKLRDVVDVLQIPAFLARQTSLIEACAETGKAINVKKPQFFSPKEMQYVVEKIVKKGNTNILLTERGTMFGYNTLIVDFRSLSLMSEFSYPVILDITHSTQMPGAGTQSGGQRWFAPLLARAGVAVGLDGLFMEVHNSPEKALSDSECQIRPETALEVIEDTFKIQRALREKEESIGKGNPLGK